MDRFFVTLIVFVACGTSLAVTLLILISHPKSKLRDFFVEIFGWAFALFCVVYVVTPVDILSELFLGPIGFIDDGAAAAAGMAASVAAWKAGQARKQMR